MSDRFATFAHDHWAWESARVELFQQAFSLYFERARDLATRSQDWPHPRLRHVGIVQPPYDILPYSQMLNTSAWTLYACDFDPALSNVEFAAYLFAHGDRMALTGEVTQAALRNAAYWFERTPAETEAITRAADASDRPDAQALRSLARAIPWLRKLHHQTLRPPRLAGSYRPLPGSQLAVGRDIEDKPPALVNEWTRIAKQTVAQAHRRWATSNLQPVKELLDWLRNDCPPLVIVGRRRRILWHDADGERIGALRGELKAGAGEAVRSIYRDLRIVAQKTEEFLAAVDRERLGTTDADALQSGYVFMHHDAGTLAYDLHESGIERLSMPALPYADAMLAARATHEWCHLADDAGWIPLAVAEDELAQRIDRVATALSDICAQAPSTIRKRTQEDLAALGPEPGVALSEILLQRMPDFRANVLAQRFLSTVERETYVRQNIRSLRTEYRPEQLWRMLIRYLYELQYLRFSEVQDRVEFLVQSTWFDEDFIATGVVSMETLAELDDRLGHLVESWRVDESRVRTPPQQAPISRA